MKKYLFLISVAMIAVASCNKVKEPDALTIDKKELSASAEGGSATVLITSNVDWAITSVETYDWITLSRTSGTGNSDVLFTFAQNTGIGREAEFSIAGGTVAPIAIHVTQESAKSDMRIGTPYMKDAPIVGEANKTVVYVPYTNALGTESVTFNIVVDGYAKDGYAPQPVTVDQFAAGNGEVSVVVAGTPTKPGPVSITLSSGDDAYDAVSVRVCEPARHSKMVSFNYWAIGYTREDYNLLRGSKYDQSWTSQAVKATTSGVGTDHVVLPAFVTDAAYEGAYLSLYCQNSIVAEGDDAGKPSGTPTGLKGYQFNPGLQVQGMVKDDYIFVEIPKVSASKILVETAAGGAKAAANAYIIEYSTDKTTWTAFDSPKEQVIGDVNYPYHTAYVTTYDSRYVYAHDAATDKTYVEATATLSSAVNGALYVRLRATGVNGAPAVQTGTGWGDIKFLDIAFE